MDFEVLWRYRADFMAGMGGTLLLSVQTIVLGTLLAVAGLPLRL